MEKDVILKKYNNGKTLPVATRARRERNETQEAKDARIAKADLLAKRQRGKIRIFKRKVGLYGKTST